MGQEIERKYLIHHDKWNALNKPEAQRYRQGYLFTDPQKTIRVRVTDTTAYLTIKGISVGATRSEYEYQIPRDEAVELLDKLSVSELSKKRYKIDYHGKTWEVDEFMGDNGGLIVAEIELNSEDESYDIPEWVAEDVTDQQKYYNSNLTIHPFKDW